MNKETSPFNCPPRASLVFFAVLLASAFAASPADHEGAIAGNSTPEILDSLPPDIRPRIEQEAAENPNFISPASKQSMSRPDLGVTEPNIETVKPKIEALPAPREAPNVDKVSQYLWNVYQRSSTKADSHGDFTWKDAVAAARLDLSIQEYVIGGMDPDFRELLFDVGRAMDAAGIDWTILSAYRDDYRQSLAAGFKAHLSNSFHGGSVATGGYGHGCAVDLAATDGIDASNMVWKWIDQHGRQFGLHRPLGRVDPAHVQPTGAWHELAATLRSDRIATGNEYVLSSAAEPGAEIQRSQISADHSLDAGISEVQFTCVRPPPDDAKKTEGNVIHVPRLNAALRSSNAGKKPLKARWKTAGESKVHNPRRQKMPGIV